MFRISEHPSKTLLEVNFVCSDIGLVDTEREGFEKG